MFRLIRISQEYAVGIFRMCSVNGSFFRSYSHCTSGIVPVTSSIAEKRLSPLKLYPSVGSSSVAPSRQMSWNCIACTMASRALQAVAPGIPEICGAFTSPNMIRSFRLWITCSSATVRVSVSALSVTVFTRHTMPFPGSVSSSIQSPTPTAGASGPRVSCALLFRSSRCRLIASGRM